MRGFVVCAVLALGAAPAPARAEAAEPSTLSILTWNVFMMPRWTRESPGNEERARAIASELLKRHNELASDDTGRVAELDYVLVRRNGHDVGGTWERLVLRHPWDGNRRKDLSYRYAVAARLTWR